MRRSSRRYNWVPDLPDHRDLRLRLIRSDLPSAVDLRPKCPPVVNQGNVGSCTGNALAGALGFLELQEQNAGLQNQAEEFSAAGFQPFSRLFIYYNERDIEGDTDQDGGAQIRDGVKSLANLGSCSELTWPYDEAEEFQKPSPEAYNEALNHKITSYLSLDETDASNLKGCLAAGFPFVFGFSVFQSFESAAVVQTGEVPMPSPDESCLGGHAVLAVGYDDQKGHFIVRNSWGEAWGDNGYFYLPYSYVTSPDLASDFWTIRK